MTFTENLLIEQIGKILLEQTGMKIRARDIPKLRAVINSRMKSLQLTDAVAYHRLIMGDSAESCLEREDLTHAVTIGESYFFRDSGQISVLRNVILPQLIERRKRSRSMRLWSAGCSTGEEAYSLAILVDELLPDRSNWDISILGTDLSWNAIVKAKHGSYSAWSFRQVGPDMQKRYFQKRKDRWRLDRRIMNRVAFHNHNLIRDAVPDRRLGICDMDLIICRNVFIYFNQEAVSHTVQKLAQALRWGGYLMAGHNELYGARLGELQARVYPGSVIYQRVDIETSIGEEKSATPRRGYNPTRA